MELDTLNLRIKMLKKNATKQPATIESLYNKFHEVNNPDREKKIYFEILYLLDIRVPLLTKVS